MIFNASLFSPSPVSVRESLDDRRTPAVRDGLHVTRRLDRLFRRLRHFCVLTQEEEELLCHHAPDLMLFAPREDLFSQRRPVDGLFVLAGGFACRYKLLPDGRRQILGLLLPGDICDLRALVLARVDYSICAVNTVTATHMPVRAAMHLLERSPGIARALWWTAAVQDAITREWLVNVGSRTAFERVAHLFCEVYSRLEAVGLVRDNRCELPLTQMDLADALALSSVHVNRTLMAMRRQNLVRVQSGQLELLDRAGLEAAAGFDRAYLHADAGALRLHQVDESPALLERSA